jgi:hypothetical protein
LSGKVRIIQQNKESLVVASKETGLTVNAENTQYMAMSRDQNAGRSHGIKTDNSFFEMVEKFKYSYLGTTLTNQNSIQEEIKSRLKSGNACYHLVQDLLSSGILSKYYISIKTHRTIICLLFCMGVKLGLSH